MGYLILIFVILVVLYMILSAIYRRISILVGRIQDLCRYKNTTASIYPLLLLLIGIVSLCISLSFPFVSWGSLSMGVIFIAVPVLWQISKNGLEFWKIFVIKFFAFFIYTAQIILGVIVTHDKKKRVKNWDGSVTEYSWKMPERIVQDGYDLNFIYQSAGILYYENYDGLRCVCDHAPTMSFDNVKYEIRPLYNVRDPLPRWVAWLY